MYDKFENIFFFKQFFMQLPADVIRKSSLACGISDSTDGSQDEITDFPPLFLLNLKQAYVASSVRRLRPSNQVLREAIGNGKNTCSQS